MILDGIRVIDFSQYLPGPFTSQRLANLGAEVIKVESLNGDPAREFGLKIGEGGAVFQANNRNKKSVAIDLKQLDGRNLAYKLIKHADVIIESFRPGVMDRLGLSYEQVKEVKEDIIYCSLTGFGQKGVLSQHGSHDLNYMALSGVLAQLKDNQGKLIQPSFTFADLIGGIVASEQIITALLQKERKGNGQYIDLSIVDSMVPLMNTHIAIEKESGRENGISLIDRELISYYIYETKDGRSVSLAALEPKFWKNYCIAVNREDWIPAHSTKPSEDNNVFKQVKELFLSRTLEEWTQFGLEVDCCLTPNLKVNELHKHPFIEERELIPQEFNSPQLGEHTEDIFKSLLNKTEQDISHLRENNVVK